MKQLELKLKIKGTSSFDDVPTLKQLMDRQKERPKHLATLSEKHYQLLKELHKGRL
jgi:hypothetical protein